MAATPDPTGDPAGSRVLRWVLLMLGAAVTSMAVGFVVGLARPRTTSLPARAGR